MEVVSAALERIDSLQPGLNAFTVVLADEAMSGARAADERVRSGAERRSLPPLLGVPVSVKDHIWMAGARATNGSVALRDFVPPEDAVPVARLRESGAVIVGKTNNPEFCYRGFTDNLVFGPTRNPWDLDRTSGGSSGGAGASVSAGMTPIALGTDGGGSIRIPASFCGVVGHKPTFGLVPKEPGFKGWKTLSVDGPLARSVRDAALALGVIAGPAPADDMSYPGPLVDYLSAAEGGRDLSGLRIGWSADLGLLQVDADVRAVFAGAVRVFQSLGAELVESAPAAPHPAELWNSIALAEGFSSEGPLLAQWAEQMSEGTAEIVEAGRRISGGAYVDALHEKGLYTRTWAEFFDSGIDLFLMPTLSVTAFPVGELTPATVEGQPVDPFFDDWCSTCLPANLTGMPATSVPAGFGDRDLPVGVQVMGPRWSDSLTLRVAAAFESAVPWTGFVPHV
ncbi:MAG: aspartyl-tRNA(Asn)/glutamyl-tRNA(Gln) amidotransferase subunit [Actinomycetota bacterium]|nr:aspartyl-tRNA(Asn)/glutamyl-tRNA(Gln) amidotransferase subunit [Actinomycetota bacterium]